MLRERREQYRRQRLERRNDSRQSSSANVSRIKVETASNADSNVSDIVAQPEQPFRRPEFPSEQMTSATGSDDGSGDSSEANLCADDRRTQSIYGNDDDQLSELTEARSKRKRKQTQHFGVPVDSNTRGLLTADHYNAILENNGCVK